MATCQIHHGHAIDFAFLHGNGHVCFSSAREKIPSVMTEVEHTAKGRYVQNRTRRTWPDFLLMASKAANSDFAGRGPKGQSIRVREATLVT